MTFYQQNYCYNVKLTSYFRLITNNELVTSGLYIAIEQPFYT